MMSASPISVPVGAVAVGGGEAAEKSIKPLRPLLPA